MNFLRITIFFCSLSPLTDEKLVLSPKPSVFRLIYPDFLQSVVWNRRNALFEELQRKDMLERRMQLDIPEFYVGE